MVQLNRLWIPEEMTHLYYLPIYQTLTSEEKLSYNHAFACLFIEHIIVLETEVFNRFITNALSQKKQFAPEFKEALQKFVAQEAEHSAVFWKALASADPSYENSQYQCHQPSITTRFALSVLLRLSNFFIFWVWIPLFFEEKFILLYRYTKRSGDAIDSSFEELYRYHLIDEVEHVRLDELVVRHFWDPAPFWKKWLNGILLRLFFHRALCNWIPAWKLWKEAVQRNPGLGKYNREVRDQLKGLSRSKAYRQHFLSDISHSVTYRALRIRRECLGALRAVT